MSLTPRQREALMSAVPAVLAGGGAALQSSSDQDPAGTMFLKTALAGSAGALAGKYLTPLLRQGARDLGGRAVEAAKGLQGQGLLSAAVGLPAAALVGTAAYQAGRAINSPLDSMKVPGFQNQASYTADQNQLAYEALVNELGSLGSNVGAYGPVNPEAYGISSNTQGALIGMA